MNKAKPKTVKMDRDELAQLTANRPTHFRRPIANKARGADRVIWTDKGELYPPSRKPERYVGWVAEVAKLNGLHLPLACPYEVGMKLIVPAGFKAHFDVVVTKVEAKRVGPTWYWAVDCEPVAK